MAHKKTKREKQSQQENEYSKYIYNPIFNHAKKLRELSAKDRTIKQKIINSLSCSTDPQLAIFEYRFIQNIIENGFKNIFIEDNNLSYFLKNNMPKEKTIYYIEDLIKKSEDSKKHTTHNSEYYNFGTGEFNILNNEKTSGVFLNYCVYTKDEKFATLFGVEIIENENKKSYNLFCFNGDDVSYVPLHDFKKCSFMFAENKMGRILRMILNLLYYMDAFPDKIFNGPPWVTKEKQSNDKTIKMSEQISNYLNETRDISPHLRRGHFRYLESDFYKNKKGQTIFINPTFVKGEAKTIKE